jgi:hypothetical protein
MNYNAVISASFEYGETVAEPVTLQEAKDWCRIDVPDDDALITSLITGARIICENYSGLSFVTKTVTAVLVNGLGNIDLPYGPVAGAVTYTEIDGTAITGYDISDGRLDRFKASYTAGYGTLPQNLKTALLNQIAWMNQNRGDAKLASALSENAKLILNQIRP